jgi:hypothetical protein
LLNHPSPWIDIALFVAVIGAVILVIVTVFVITTVFG